MKAGSKKIAVLRLPLGALAVAGLLVVSGCAAKHSAPVIERAAAKKPAQKAAKEADWRPQTHTVQKGETLYGISLEYGFGYKELAELNGIEPPYIIRVGQQLKIAAAQPAAVATPLKPASAAAEVKPLAAGDMIKTQPKAVKTPYSAQAENQPAPAKAAAAEEKPPAAEASAKPPEEKKENGQPAGDDDDKLDWAWPAAGKVVAGFNEGTSKGVDIAGKPGQPVLASAPGKVVYSGSGLRGYGKLVIVKHNKTYLTAYAHNSQILVKEGQAVVKGQRIAEMGDSDADQVKLHFEIRRFGKPVDPMKYLANAE
jgi:lipoprotein NlpD